MKFIYITITFLLIFTNTFAQNTESIRKFHPSLFTVRANNYGGLQLSLDYNIKNNYGLIVSVLTTSRRPPTLPENYSTIAFTNTITDKLNSTTLSVRKKVALPQNKKILFCPAVGVSYTKFVSKYSFEKRYSLLANDYYYKSEKAYVIGVNIETKVNYAVSKNHSISLLLLSNFNLYKNIYGFGIGYVF